MLKRSIVKYIENITKKYILKLYENMLIKLWILGCKSNCRKIDKRLVAGIGLENILIVDTEDVVLVCHKDRCQDIKELVKNISSSDDYERFI